MKGRRFWGIASLLTLVASGVYIALKADYFMLFLVAVFTYSYDKLNDVLSYEDKLKDCVDN